MSASGEEISSTTETMVEFSKQLAVASEETSKGAENLAHYSHELRKIIKI